MRLRVMTSTRVLRRSRSSRCREAETTVNLLDDRCRRERKRQRLSGRKRHDVALGGEPRSRCGHDVSARCEPRHREGALGGSGNELLESRRVLANDNGWMRNRRAGAVTNDPFENDLGGEARSQDRKENGGGARNVQKSPHAAPFLRAMKRGRRLASSGALMRAAREWFHPEPAFDIARRV
jgi:hypothetical protein